MATFTPRPLGNARRPTVRPQVRTMQRGLPGAGARATFNPYGAQVGPVQAYQTPAQAGTEATQQQTANITPSVAGLVGKAPIRQEAYEQQAQTQLQSNLARDQAAAQSAGEQARLAQTQEFQGRESGLERGHDLARTQLAGRLQSEQLGQQQQFQGRESGLGRAHDLAQAELAAKLQAEQDARRAGLSKEDFENRWSKITSLPPIDGGVGGDAGISAGLSPAETAARNAAFARAKDRQGQTSRAAIDALRGVLSETGNLGGGQEAAGIGSIISSGAGNLGEFEREQAIGDVGRIGQVADRNYAGGLARRGQDIGYRQSLLGLLGSGRSLY